MDSAILLVDPDPAARDALRRAMSDLDHPVFEAGDWVDALRVVAAEPVAAVVTELELPGVPGDRLAEMITLRLGDDPVPAIFLYTAASPALRGAAANRVRAAGSFGKPGERDALVAAVAAAARGRGRDLEARVSRAGAAAAEASAPAILIVEDDPDLAEMMRLALEGAGYLVGHAADWVSLSGELFRREYALILMDVELPVMSGDELAAMVLEMASNRPKIFFWSSKEPLELQQLARKSGVDGFLPKRLGRDAILKRVAEEVGG